MIDDSASLNDEEYEQEKKFVLDLIEELKPTRNGAHIALLQFSEVYLPEWLFPMIINFSSPQDLDSIIDTIKNLNQTKGRATHTDSALNTSLHVMFKEENGMRPADIPKNLVIVTDGVCSGFCGPEELRPYAKKLKEKNVRIIVVGIENEDFSEKKFNEFADALVYDKRDKMLAKDANDLNNLVKRVSQCIEIIE